jgi:hypothetical protein
MSACPTLAATFTRIPALEVHTSRFVQYFHIFYHLTELCDKITPCVSLIVARKAAGYVPGGVLRTATTPVPCSMRRQWR